MDDVTVEEGQSNERHADTVWSKHPRQQPMRLSPSESSRSSSGVADHVSSTRSSSSLPSATSRLHLNDLLNKPDDSRRESPTASRRQPVAYGSGPVEYPAERPSLPSLRTVLGNAISSSPKTPSPQTALSRSSPTHASFEPNYADPYPIKKQRTGSAEHYSRPYATDTTYSASFGPPVSLEPQYNSKSTKHDSAVYPFNTRSERVDDYRNSLPLLPTPGSTASRTSTQSYPSSHHADHSRKRSSFGEWTTSRPTPDVTPASVLEPNYPPHYGSDGRRHNSFVSESQERMINERTLPLHPASRSPGLYSPQSQDHDSSGLGRNEDSWYPNPAREGGAYSLNDVNAERTSQSTSQDGEGNSSFSSPNSTQPFFMSGQFEAPNGRSRKRSNLPKHSTEIMKRWFEQNMANPYPSEEQKAIFSNATGISMTQVSNWFINHRRRCPELRDKREKSRVEQERDEQD